MGKRVLVTGIDTFWGGRMAHALEGSSEVDVVLGMGIREPTIALERTEFVRSDQTYSILARIVRATQVDTVVHTFLVTDSTRTTAKAVHEINVIGTMNLLAACGAAGSSVRHMVIKSSTLVYGASPYDPTWFREEDVRKEPPRTPVERSLIEVEDLIQDFAEDNPHTVVTVLRFANVLGPDIVTPLSSNLSRALVPSVAGFDPSVQFVEETDVVRCLEYFSAHEIPGLYNVAGKGRIPWSEVLAICGRRPLWLPPLGTRASANILSRLGLIIFPPEIEDLLHYGRGVDTSRLEASGFHTRYSTAGAVRSFIRALRLRQSLGGDDKPLYRYEADVETFFRHSPAVVRANEP